MGSSEFTKKVPLELLCLRLLEERDMYGYEIMTEIRNRSQGVIDISLPTIYFALKRLTENGSITSYDMGGSNAHERSRMYYHLETPGHKNKEELQALYDRAIYGVKLFFETFSEGGKEIEPFDGN